MVAQANVKHRGRRVPEGRAAPSPDGADPQSACAPLRTAAASRRYGARDDSSWWVVRGGPTFCRTQPRLAETATRMAGGATEAVDGVGGWNGNSISWPTGEARNRCVRRKRNDSVGQRGNQSAGQRSGLAADDRKAPVAIGRKGIAAPRSRTCRTASIARAPCHGAKSTVALGILLAPRDDFSELAADPRTAVGSRLLDPP